MSQRIHKPLVSDHFAAAYVPLLRVYIALSGDRVTAEDLAQETMAEALRLQHRIYAVDGVERWLAAVARHLWRRWRRQRVGERLHLLPAPRDGLSDNQARDDIPDNLDLEAILERQELASLLDRALALLPLQTRDALIQRFVHEAPYAEIAARLGLSEHTAVMRVQRGKLALREVLLTTLREEAATYGLVEGGRDHWQDTAVWCPECGQQRLLGRFVRADGHFTLRCPRCFPGYEAEPNTNLAHLIAPAVLGGVQGYKPALNRVMAHAHTYYTAALDHHAPSCLHCGRPAALYLGLPPHIPASVLGTTGVYVACPHCGGTFDLCLKGFALWSPIGRAFWKRHGRIAASPERRISVDGHPALLISFHRVGGQGRLDMVFAADTLAVLTVAEMP